MSDRRRKAAPFAWRCLSACGSGCCQFLSIVGVGLLACLVSLLAFALVVDEIPVPAVLLAKLETALAERGLAIKTASYSLSPNGRLVAESPAIVAADFGDAVFSAERASIDIGLPLLLFGRIDVNRVSVANGALLSPAVLSPSGVAEPLLSNIELALESRLAGWKISHAKADFGKARLHASGQLDHKALAPFLELLRMDPPPATFNEFLALAVTDAWRWRARAAERFGGRVSLDARFGRNGGDRQTARVQLLAESARLPAALSAGPTRIVASWTEGHNLRLDIQARDARAPRAVELDRLRAALSLPRANQLDKPLKLTFQAALGPGRRKRFEIPGAVVEGAFGPEGFEAAARLLCDGLPWSLAIAKAAGAKTAEARLDAAIGRNVPALANDLHPLRDLTRLLSLQRPADLALDARVGPDLALQRADARLLVSQANALGAPIDFARAQATLQGPRLDASSIRVRSGEQSGSLSVHYNLDTSERRVLVEGRFEPKTINSWIEPWWGSLWDNFDFPPHGLYISLDARSVLGDPRATRVKGLAQSGPFAFRDLPMRGLRARLNTRFAFVDLFDFRLERDEGYLAGEGQFHIPVDPSDGQPKVAGLWIDAASTLDLHIAPDALRELRQPVADILEPYRYDTPPRVAAKASSVLANRKAKYSVDLDIDTDEPIDYRGFPLQSLRAEVAIDNQGVSLREARAGLGDGLLSLEADTKDGQLSFDARLADASFGKSLKAAAIYFEGDDADQPAGEDPQTYERYGGRVRARLSARGPFGDPFGFQGQGEYRIEDADLGQIRLLGLLSRALEVTPLRFTTLKFDEAYGDLAVDQQLLRFENLHLKGPMATIRADGAYDMRRGQLDFRAKLFPFRNTKMPLFALVGIVLDPLSRALEARLTGTIENPQWSLFSGGGPAVEAEAPEPSAEPPPKKSPRDPAPPPSN